MILDERQQSALKRIRSKRHLLREAKIDALPRAKALVDAEIADYLLDFDLEVRRAVESGIPKMRVRQDGMGTKDSRTLEESLARTASIARAVADNLAEDPLAYRYKLREDGDIDVTIDGLTVPFAVRTRADGSTYVTKSVESDWDSPVVAWMGQRKPDHEAETLAWFSERKAA